MHNTLFIIVTHLDGGAFIRKLVVKFSYCVLTALMCGKIPFCKCDYRYWDILDDQDNFVVNIEIFLNALLHTSNPIGRPVRTTITLYSIERLKTK